MQTKGAIKPAIRYSKAFKLQVVNEVESQGVSAQSVGRKYGVKGCYTVNRWVGQYGNGTRGKIIRVETPKEIDELKRLKERLKRLEGLLADASIDLAIERAYVQIACEQAGIQDVAEFKKKHPGGQRT
jgi:transposase-like protein